MMLRFKGAAVAEGLSSTPTALATVPRRSVHVGMGQLVVGSGEQELVVYGLGSCIGLALWCPARRIGALCHIVLPSSRGVQFDPATPAKYADWAVPRAVNLLARKGARPKGLVAKMVGGAHPLAASLTSEVGKQNTEVTKEHVRQQGIRLLTEETGGTVGRTIRFHPVSGGLEVRQVSGEWRAL